MCRYAMITYKPHFACFDCRKTFKRRLLGDVLNGFSKDTTDTPAKCPECGGLMANMGLDFESPKKKDIRQWQHIATLYKVGITFHSCGCSGPGYIPKNTEELIQYFSKIKDNYLKHQHFWATRKNDPEAQNEIAKDKNKNRDYLYNVPKTVKTGTKNKPKYNAFEAQTYWNNKVLEIDEKLKTLKPQ